MYMTGGVLTTVVCCKSIYEGIHVYIRAIHVRAIHVRAIRVRAIHVRAIHVRAIRVRAIHELPLRPLYQMIAIIHRPYRF